MMKFHAQTLMEFKQAGVTEFNRDLPNGGEMRILVLHRIPYHKINYERGIDHLRHDVTYVGVEEALANIPQALRCARVARAGARPVAEEVIELFRGFKFDRVISLSEYELVAAAQVREALGAEGPALADVLLTRDKILMKEAVAGAGLRVPRHFRCDSLEAASWQGPTVLKPVDGASSENVKIYETLSSAIEAIKRGTTGITGFQPAAFELEEFVAGPIVHIDGLVVDGRIECWLASRYIGTCLGFANGSPLGSVQLESSPELRNWSQAVIDAVKIGQGSFHLEVIISSGGPVFLEIANRVGGADVVDTFELATGVFLPAAELAALTGDRSYYDYRRSMREPSESFGWFVFPGHHLQAGFARISGTEALTGSARIVRMSKVTDKPLPRKITYQSVEVPLSGIARGKTASELTEWMSHAFSSISISSSEQACQSS